MPCHRRWNVLAFRSGKQATTTDLACLSSPSLAKWLGFLRGGSSSNAEDGEKPWWQVVLLVTFAAVQAIDKGPRHRVPYSQMQRWTQAFEDRRQADEAVSSICTCISKTFCHSFCKRIEKGWGGGWSNGWAWSGIRCHQWCAGSWRMEDWASVAVADPLSHQCAWVVGLRLLIQAPG